MKKNVSTTGTSTREKMLARKKQLESKANGEGFVYPKEGTLRVRVKSPGDDQELGMELITFYISGTGSVISPATFNEPCPFMDKYNELKDSDDDADRQLAKDKLVPRRKYVVGGIIYNDEKGKEVAYDGKDKLVQIPISVYRDIIDLYLDDDEAGDMTDPVNGYDIKIIRTGSGKRDTEYSTRACKNTKIDPKYRGNIDIEKMVRAHIKPYDELENILNNYLNESSSDDDYQEEEEDTPKKKKKSLDSDKPIKKKKKYKSDI